MRELTSRIRGMAERCDNQSEIARMLGTSRQYVHFVLKKQCERPQQYDLNSNVRYKDTGCEFAPSCLNCPFPICLEEVDGGKNEIRRHYKRQEIVTLVDSGKSAKQVALELGIHRRTVERALAKRKSLVGVAA